MEQNWNYWIKWFWKIYTFEKIIAGLDNSFQGTVSFSEGYNIGYLDQDPKLDENKTVIDVVKEGMHEAIEILTKYNKINDSFALT